MLRQARVENGLVEGIPAADPRITAFKGIPYAAPPVGQNRWRAPQPAADWEGVLPCYRFKAISMQKIPGDDRNNIYTREWHVDSDVEMSEDSLYLNIWTPACSADEKLPVFVWYFGGGLQEGYPSEMEFDGERVARRGIVVVTVNYRLNAFGFLCHPEITAENPEFPANFGWLDQRFATMWVKRNIGAFGGDSENITIGGQSAGGGSCMAQVCSPLNRGLFQKAVVHSGVECMPYPPGLFGPPRSMKESEAMGVAFFEKLGVKSLAEARELPAELIRDKMLEQNPVFYAAIDGNFVPAPSNEMYMRGDYNHVPIMFGHTSTEFPSYPRNVKTVEDFEAYARKTFGEDADEFLSQCSSRIGSIDEMMYKAKTQHHEYSHRLFAQKKAEIGDTVPMYYWVLDPEIPGWDNPGVFHSCDLWFFFANLAKCWRPFKGKHYDLARMMCNYWTNFMRSGDPNGKDADGTDMPYWAPYTEQHPVRMWFGDSCVTEEKGPGPLMAFLLRFAKKSGR